jgi:hypothetical protein
MGPESGDFVQVENSYFCSRRTLNHKKSITIAGSRPTYSDAFSLRRSAFGQETLDLSK